MTEQKLRGRICVVTGASSGIGEATAKTLAGLGAVVVLGARRQKALSAVRDAIVAAGGTAEALELDVTELASCQAFAEATLERHGPIDVLVNNAGLARGLATVLEADEQDWREMMEANVMGLMRMTKLFLPGLVEKGIGDIVHVGSVAGVQAYAKGSAYCASKAAVEFFVQSLRLELLGTRIRQLVIEPGMVETEFSKVRFHGDAERAEATYRGMTPLTAQDVADCIAFALTRPPHVCIQQLLLLAADQATATLVARRETDG